MSDRPDNCGHEIELGGTVMVCVAEKGDLPALNCYDAAGRPSQANVQAAHFARALPHVHYYIDKPV